jgi:phage-related protein
MRFWWKIKKDYEHLQLPGLLWIKKAVEYEEYAYITTRADDLIIAEKHQAYYVNEMEQEMLTNNKADLPLYYLARKWHQEGWKIIYYMVLSVYY